MPSLLNLVPSAVSAGRTQIIYGEVTTPAPAAFTDTLYVIIPDWSVDFPVAFVDWPAVHGTTLPLPGDEALILVDSRGIHRCVWWGGQMTFATQTSRTYYLTTTASDVASHTQITSAPFSPKTTVPFTGLVNGQTLLDYMSPPGVPGSSFVPAGQFEFHVHAKQTAGAETVQVYAEFWEYDPIGATHVAMIGQSQTSQALTSDEVEYRLFFTRADVYTFVSAQSRIAVHVHVVVGGTGGANVSFFVGGTADSHVTTPASPVVLPSAWIAPTLATNWANLGGGNETAGYLKDPLGFVHLRGIVKKSIPWVALENVFTLPIGFRPGGVGVYTDFLWDATNGFLTAAWNINTIGNVLLDSIPRPGGPGIVNSVTLSGITFLAEN